MELSETAWVPTNRICSCCGRQPMFAKITGPWAGNRFGRRLATYICRVCDFSGDTALPALFTGPDPRRDPL